MTWLRLDWIVACTIVIVMSGCGRDTGKNGAATSQEDLAEFLEDNPEYSLPPPSGSKSKTPLDLGN